MLYEQIMMIKVHANIKKKLFNLIFIRLSFYISLLNKRVDDNHLNIKNAYQKFIKNKVPIEIFVKQYKQDSNSLLYDLNTTTNDDKIQITLHNTRKRSVTER